MSALSFALIFALTTVLLAEFVNGWTDAPNVIAVVVSTGVMSPKTAILMAVLMNTAGAMSGTAVATTVGKGIVDPASLTLPSITAAMLSIVAWGTFAAQAGLPVSKSHALLAGLAGAAFAGGGLQALEWAGWAKVLIGMVLSLLLGGVASFGIGLLVVFVAGASKPARTKGLFDRLSVVAACFLAFNHGLNDGQKFMGVFATTLLTGGAVATFQIPFWVILLCALTMAVGTSAGGWRIIRTIGLRMTRLEFMARLRRSGCRRLHDLWCFRFWCSAFDHPHHYKRHRRRRRQPENIGYPLDRLETDIARLADHLPSLLRGGVRSGTPGKLSILNHAVLALAKVRTGSISADIATSAICPVGE